MRLLMLQGNGCLSLTKNFVQDTPPYAILSHTWGDDDQEVTFKDVEDGVGKDKDGYRKILFCGQQAASDGLQYFWVDTCCINKSDNAELSEAINSMFKWYQKATRCYVHLSDVSKDHNTQNDDPARSTWKLALRKSRWFTRGWTLQELIAPSSVEFFSTDGQRLGDKNSLEQLLHEITMVAIGALRGRALSEFTVDERMSWSSGRVTKREEDRAYSLFGMFSIHLPPIYGEGVDNAFIRLREEISKRSTIGRGNLAPSDMSIPECLRHPRAVDPHGDNGHTSLTKGGGTMIEKAEIGKELLDMLYFNNIDERLLTLQAAHNKTCQWFLRKEQYRAWLSNENVNDHRGFLWIKGKPGAGKSILMKFLDSEAKKVAKSNPYTLVISFFFNARGEYLERSTIGLYRSLLWQLIQKAEDLQEVVLDEFDAQARRIIRRDGWQLEVLKQTLAKAVEHLGCRTLQIFVDALDECHDDDVTDMISFFEDIGERVTDAKVRVHICFSSRHYPAVIVRWGTQVVLENEEEHGIDIWRYIKSKLNLGKSTLADHFRLQVLEKSARIFLWVALVIPILNKVCAKGRVDEFQKCLDGIPPGLDNLFEMILMRDREDMQELRFCVQWILFARRPLTLDEYFFAIRNPNSAETVRFWMSGNVSTDDKRRFVHSSSKGLAEMTRTRSKDNAATIQFIHESVRDFFLVKDGHQRLWPDLDGHFVTYSHKVLKDRCLAEINASGGSRALASLMEPLANATSQMGINVPKDMPPNESLPKASSPEASTLRQSVSEELPFLEYAVHHVLSHADASEVDIIKHTTFLTEFPLKYWIYLDNIFEKFQIRRHTLSASLIYILAEKNLPKLISSELRRIPHMDIQGERYHFPLFAACANDNREAITALLMQEPQLQNNSDLALQLRYLCGIKPQSQTPLLCAIMEGDEGIVKLLLDTGKVDTNWKDENGTTPLLYAARKGSERKVKMLLNTGKVDPDSKATDSYNAGRTPLSYAAGRGSESMVKMLLDTGKVDPDSKTTGEHNAGRTPLSYAVDYGSENIIEMLLNTGKVDPDSKATGSSNAGRTPLSYAAAKGSESIVKLLLDTGKVDPDSKATSDHNTGWTPLRYATQKGHEGIVKLLQATHRV